MASMTTSKSIPRMQFNRLRARMALFVVISGILVRTLTRAKSSISSHFDSERSIPIESRSELKRHNIIIHVGPPKTGTTATQCGLRKYQSILETIDGYHVLETESCRPDNKIVNELSSKNGLKVTNGGVATYDNVVLGASFLPNCLLDWSRHYHNEKYRDTYVDANSTLPRCWTDSYLRLIDEKMANGTKNFVMSQEHMINPFISLMKLEYNQNGSITNGGKSLSTFFDSLHSRGIDVTLVAGYRPFYEYVRSALGQTYNKPYAKKKLSRWVEQGGVEVPTLEMFYKARKWWTFTNDFIKMPWNKYPQVQVKVMDMHEGGDVFENFACNYMVDASATCQHIRNTNANKTNRENDGKADFLFDRIASKAGISHLINIKEHDRIKIGRMANSFFTEELGLTFSDLPKVCLSSSLRDDILNETLIIQKEVFYEDNESDLKKQEAGLRLSFESYLSQGKFCWPDTELIFKDERWINFFQRLKNA